VELLVYNLDMDISCEEDHRMTELCLVDMDMELLDEELVLLDYDYNCYINFQLVGKLVELLVQYKVLF
jgi:hypothetical protein